MTAVARFAFLAKRGMRHMLIRQVFATAVSFGGSVILARVLNPSEFGTYAIATFIVNIFMVFGDLGLGASFIQASKSPSDKFFRISFTIQLAMATTVVAVTWVVAPWVIGLYHSVQTETVWLVRVMSLLLYLPVLRSASTIQLERRLDYRPIAWSEGVGISLYQIIATICALKGMGVWSFVLATLLSGLVSLFIVYRSSPWAIGLCFDWIEIRQVLNQGISFQSVAILDALSQWATPAIAGTLVGPSAVGYLGMALANAKRPLLLAESVMRVSFPHFSRLQEEIEKLHQAVNDYIVALLWVMFGWVGLLWSCSSPMVTLIYSAKWLPATPALVIFALALPMDIIVWTVGMSLRATNRNWTAVKIFAVRTTLNLGLAALLVPRFGFLGIPVAYVVANTVCALLLLYNFAPGFLRRITGNASWIISCVLLAYLSGRLVTDLAARSETMVFQQFIAGAVPFGAVYLLCSLALAPAYYRHKLSELLRPLFSRRRAPMFTITPRADEFGCAVSED